MLCFYFLSWSEFFLGLPASWLGSSLSPRLMSMSMSHISSSKGYVTKMLPIRSQGIERLQHLMREWNNSFYWRKLWMGGNASMHTTKLSGGNSVFFFLKISFLLRERSIVPVQWRQYSLPSSHACRKYIAYFEALNTKFSVSVFHKQSIENFE